MERGTGLGGEGKPFFFPFFISFFADSLNLVQTHSNELKDSRMESFMYSLVDHARCVEYRPLKLAGQREAVTRRK